MGNITKPSWENAPSWAEWLAQDYYGDWHWFRHKPHISKSGSAVWICRFDRRRMQYTSLSSNINGRGERAMMITGEIIEISAWAGFTQPADTYKWTLTLEKNPKGVNTMADQEIMTVEQVAKLLSRSKNTIYMMVFQKRIPYYKPNRKSLYFRKSEIEAWAFKNRIS